MSDGDLNRSTRRPRDHQGYSIYYLYIREGLDDEARTRIFNQLEEIEELAVKRPTTISKLERSITLFTVVISSVFGGGMITWTLFTASYTIPAQYLEDVWFTVLLTLLGFVMILLSANIARNEL